MRSRLFTILVVGALATGAGPAMAADLKSIMAQLGRDMRQVSDGILLGDLEQVAQGAQAVADHPRPSIGQRWRILQGMGDELEGFRQADALVHDKAVELGEAAHAGDRKQALRRYFGLVEACIACHDKYREPVRELMRD
ncbi:cytochrome c [Thiohalomonas denitrificans]|uniref:cytochrome c n=1 Tax=Thiohalomonas denitrificans TaxID=415747 RepID=UPI0026EBEBA6|nr:cytochrome c [Thiohalomonas denitrificans]